MQHSYDLKFLQRILTEVPDIRPGTLELYLGPMHSGKTREIVHRILNLVEYGGLREDQYVAIRPSIDNRGTEGRLEYTDPLTGQSVGVYCEMINYKKPEDILKLAEKRKDALVWTPDEINMFESVEETLDVLKHLQRIGKHIIGGGLPLNFRGETWGALEQATSFADVVYKLHGHCDYSENGDRCGLTAHHTQRLRNGEPEEYTRPILFIEDDQDPSGDEVSYESRCWIHHDVPGKKVPKYEQEFKNRLRSISLEELRSIDLLSLKTLLNGSFTS